MMCSIEVVVWETVSTQKNSDDNQGIRNDVCAETRVTSCCGLWALFSYLRIRPYVRGVRISVQSGHYSGKARVILLSQVIAERHW